MAVAPLSSKTASGACAGATSATTFSLFSCSAVGPVLLLGGVSLDCVDTWLSVSVCALSSSAALVGDGVEALGASMGGALLSMVSAAGGAVSCESGVAVKIGSSSSS